jgi:hypothetical protein
MHADPTVPRNRTLKGDLAHLEEIITHWPHGGSLRIELSYNEGQAVAQIMSDTVSKSIVGVGRDVAAAIRDLRDVLDAAALRSSR